MTTDLTQIIPDLDMNAAATIGRLIDAAGLTKAQQHSLARAIAIAHTAGTESAAETFPTTAPADPEKTRVGLYYGYNVTHLVDQFAADFGMSVGAYVKRKPELYDALAAIGVELTVLALPSGDHPGGPGPAAVLHLVDHVMEIDTNLTTVSPRLDLPPTKPNFMEAFAGTYRAAQEKFTGKLNKALALLRLGPIEGGPWWYLGTTSGDGRDLSACDTGERRKDATRPSPGTTSATIRVEDNFDTSSTDPGWRAAQDAAVQSIEYMAGLPQRYLGVAGSDDVEAVLDEAGRVTNTDRVYLSRTIGDGPETYSRDGDRVDNPE